jgi:hypothetical protein
MNTLLAVSILPRPSQLEGKAHLHTLPLLLPTADSNYLFQRLMDGRIARHKRKNISTKCARIKGFPLQYTLAMKFIA